MPGYIRDALFAERGSCAWHEAAHDNFDDYCLSLPSRKLRPRRPRHPVGFTAAPATGQPPEGGQPAEGEKKEEGDGDKKEEGTQIEYQADNGKTIMLNGEDEEKCIKSCQDAPELKDQTEEGGTSMMNMASGGEKAMVGGCVRFCQTEFQIQCFPASSTVVVRDQGRVPLSKLRTGDSILVLQQRTSSWQAGDGGTERALEFEPVISWLHYEPDAEMDVVQVTHSLGEVSLSLDHLLFVRRAGSSCFEGVRAREIRIGDHVLAPWIDGSVAEPEVVALSRRRAIGAYCPLTASGSLLVDGTAASCYSTPSDLTSSPAYASLLQNVKRATGRDRGHELSHMLFFPVRLFHQTTAQWRIQFGDAKATMPISSTQLSDRDADTVEKPIEPIHPYGVFLYVLAKSFTV